MMLSDKIPDDLSPVEMHHAFFWLCPECGEKNWCEALACEDPDERAGFEAIVGEGEDALVLRTPGKVGCLKCDAWWTTEYPGSLT